MQTQPSFTQRSTTFAPAPLMERSLFGLVFLGFFLSVLVGISLLISTGTMRENQRTLLLTGYGVFLAAQFVLLIRLITMPADKFKRFSVSLIRVLGRGAAALPIAGAVIVLVFIALAVINGVFPILAPLNLLLIGGVILFLVLIGIANTDAIAAFIRRSAQTWTLIGLTGVIALAVGGLFIATQLAIDTTGLIERLRGSADYRELVFFGDVHDPALSQVYWVELGELRAEWISYTYSRMMPHDGELISIDARGLRVTVNPEGVPDDAPTIYTFGGSTMWGEGSRDAYTIPSQLSTALFDAGNPVQVTNYGQVAYVSTQDLIVFERQLALGSLPDMAVFYGGFNDVAAVTISDAAAGLPHNEINRIRDLASGTILRGGRPVVQQPNASWDDINMSLVSIPDATPEQIAGLWLDNARLIRAAAREYGVDVLFVWQPAIFFKETLSPQEQLFSEQNRQTIPGFDDLYRAIDEAVRARAAAEGLDDVLILSDLFADETRYLFYDRVHVIEDGNTLIAAAIAEHISPIMSD